MKKRIMCFGDSNTWGYMPEGQSDGFHMRYPEEVRWTGVLQQDLGPGYTVVEEGLNGRTTTFDQHGFRCRNGLAFLESTLLTNDPIDIVVLLLGTNDLKVSICGDPAKSAESISSILDAIRKTPVGPKGTSPRTLLVSPPHLGTGILFPPFSNDFDGYNSIEASKELAKEYITVARRFGADFLDASEFTETGTDGLHLTAESHSRLGAAVAKKIREMEETGSGRLKI